MNDKYWKTKSELINEWLELYPNDHDHDDLEFNATAGHVYDPQTGLYIKFRTWEVMEKQKREVLNGSQ